MSLRCRNRRTSFQATPRVRTSAPSVPRVKCAPNATYVLPSRLHRASSVKLSDGGCGRRSNRGSRCPPKRTLPATPITDTVSRSTGAFPWVAAAVPLCRSTRPVWSFRASRHRWLTRYETTNAAVHTASDYQILSESRDLTCAWKKRSDRKNVDVRTGVTSFRFDADTFSRASTRIVRDCERVRRGTRYANDEF